MLSWPIRRQAEGPFENKNMWRAMATDCKILSPLSPNCGVPLELPVAVRSKPIAQLARYIARVSPARGRGLAHEIKYDRFRSARGSPFRGYHSTLGNAERAVAVKIASARRIQSPFFTKH